jgi:hypothetical protein
MKSYEKRKLRFQEELAKYNCTTNAELKLAKQREIEQQQKQQQQHDQQKKAPRKRTFATVKRHKRREENFWKIARTNVARKEAEKLRHLQARNFGLNCQPRKEESIEHKLINAVHEIPPKL